jgi:hypothetical protein
MRLGIETSGQSACQLWNCRPKITINGYDRDSDDAVPSSRGVTKVEPEKLDGGTEMVGTESLDDPHVQPLLACRSVLSQP